ncbi:MAG: leucine-rich repeat protein, partial [Rhodospirillaceae bacterium]|nr:leucine-rich repeat protein [Rhodospirillaceae bacterium]
MPFGRAVLVINDGITVGRVYTPEGNWSIRTVGEMQTVEPLVSEPLRCGLEVGPETAGKAEAHGEDREAFQLDRLRGAHGLRPNGADVEDFKRMPHRASDDEAESGRRDARAATAASSSGATVVADDGDVVDVLVVYPSFAREIEGGYGPMLSLIDLDIATANEAYAASGVELRVELAAAVEVEYDPFLENSVAHNSGGFKLWGGALEHLTQPDSGHLDEVQALRDRHAADLVLLHVGGEAVLSVANLILGGIAWSMDRVTTESVEERGFSVAMSGDGTVVAHELGHSMGLRHDRYEDTGNEPFPYSHGFRYEHAAPRPELGPDARYRVQLHGTVMSQVSNRWDSGFVLAFSNPNLSHPQDPGLKLGVPGDEPSSAADGPADATRHLNEVRSVLANVRARADADPCRYEVLGDEADVSATGGTFRLKVETQPDCPWTVQQGEWVASVSPLDGTGSGEVSYTVGTNDGWNRSVEIVVSGKLHGRTQTGSRPITDVCERSFGVRRALENSHPDYDFTDPETGYWSPRECEELDFSAEYLASVRTLHPGGKTANRGVNAPELRPGDFDGLTGMVELWVNDVEHLPPDIFSGLIGLRVLDLRPESLSDGQTGKLRSIAEGAFRGLPGLKRLQIRGQRLRRLEKGTFEGLSGLLRLEIGGRGEPKSPEPLTLESGLFDGLPDLWTLFLFNHELAGLDPGVFSELGELRWLYLGNNSLRALDVGVFDGMPKLQWLDLEDNALTALPPGLFDGLPDLVNLWVNHNRLRRLDQGTFAGLSNLNFLGLFHNLLTTVDPGAFAGLGNLENLWLLDNRLRNLPTGQFSELESLQLLSLGRNRLGAIRAGTFDGLGELRTLYMTDAGVTALEPGVFDDTPKLVSLNLTKNRLRTIAPGTFSGVSLAGLPLEGNPGAPFPFFANLTPLPFEPGAGYPTQFYMEVAPEAPFPVSAKLSASGGSLWGPGEALVYPGEADSAVHWVEPDTDSPITVRAERVLWPGADVEEETNGPDGIPGVISITSDPGSDFGGTRVEAGPPLLLYGLSDMAFKRGRGGEAVDLRPAFSYFLGAADYEVSSSDEAVAAVRVEDGTLTVTPGAAGTAEITVTATAADGETLTRRFDVTVRVPSVLLFLSTSHSGREGFVRVINHLDRSGTVHITAIDDGGNRHGPVRLRIRANGAAHFNSRDLKDGNEAKRLLEGIGPVFAEGDWRLEFESDLDIEALSYVRTEDGFVTGMHNAAPFEDGVHRIATFNPASKTQQASRLRVVNSRREPADVTVRGVDDAGASAGSPVRFSVPPGGAREFDAVQLEAGDTDLEGALGDGEVK